MKILLKIIAYSLTAVLIASCKQEYPLPDETRNLNMLVVEGLLNSGPGPTTIRLTRTFNPKDIGNLIPELRAQVSVEGENNSSFTLTANTKGEYVHPQLNLNNNQKYRLRIKTINGKEYLSDYIPVKSSPSIDSIYWKRTADGIQLLLNTHDPQDNTRYYRWEFDETWEINSAYVSNYKYENGIVVDRPNPAAIFYCWANSSSSSIVVNSSAKLIQDVISGQPLRDIAFGSEKISVRYSILARQYALTKEAYQFWEIMKKNTEQLGTLFDPQPSQLLSNIHCINDPEDLVMGYLSAGSIQEKRIFIKRSDVEPWFYYHGCEEIVVTSDSVKFYFESGFNIPTHVHNGPTGRPDGYYASTRLCVDCTTRGSNVRPSFW